MASMLHAGTPAKAAIDQDTAAKDTAHATAKAGRMLLTAPPSS